jgi:hypothetical protein
VQESGSNLPQSMVSEYLENSKKSADGDDKVWQTQDSESLELIKNAAGMAFLG